MVEHVNLQYATGCLNLFTFYLGNHVNLSNPVLGNEIVYQLPIILKVMSKYLRLDRTLLWETTTPKAGEGRSFFFSV
jgi:hypothetical protein